MPGFNLRRLPARLTSTQIERPMPRRPNTSALQVES
jgi:hypothetical protein